MWRLSVVLVASLAAAGCSSPERKPAPAASPVAPAATSTRTASPPSADDEPCRSEVAEAAEAFKAKLAEYRFPESVATKSPGGVPRCRLRRLMNETDMRLNAAKLSDKLRDVVAGGGKISFVSEPDSLPELKQAEQYDTQSSDVSSGPPAAPAYSLQCRVKNVRTADAERRTNVLTVTVELLDQDSGAAVVSIVKEFRYSK